MENCGVFDSDYKRCKMRSSRKCETLRKIESNLGENVIFSGYNIKKSHLNSRAKKLKTRKHFCEESKTTRSDKVILKMI